MSEYLDGFPAIPRVNLSDLAHADVPAPEYIIDPIVPVRTVTMLGGHGGTGKTSLVLQISAMAAAGESFMGLDVTPCRVLFYSAEDAPQIIRWRLKRICKALDIDLGIIAENLTILDATAIDPALYCEVRDDGIRHGMTTGAFESLRREIIRTQARLIVLDNASDVFDADEINRSRVRGFIRALNEIARDHDAAILLLAHVDKNTAKNGSSEGYSGSTAWHNSSRSRLFLSADKDGVLTLEHQKLNYGQKAEPIKMQWTDDGVIVESSEILLDGQIATLHGRTILQMIAEFYDRGEFISTANNSPSNAFRSLSSESLFPRINSAELKRIVRDLEREGKIERETYKTRYRKDAERWRVTNLGKSMLQLRPSQ